MHWAEGSCSWEGAVQPGLSFAEEADSLPPVHMGSEAHKGWTVEKKTAARRDFRLALGQERRVASELVGPEERKAWIEAGIPRHQEAASGEMLWRPVLGRRPERFSLWLA